MKNILILLLLFTGITTFAQVRPRTIGDKNIPTLILGTTISDSALLIPTDTLKKLSSTDRAISYKDAFRVWNGFNWVKAGSGTGASDSLRFGGAITSLPSVGVNPNTRNIADWIDSVFYQSQYATATLTGGVNLEFRSAQTMNYTLNWSAGRLGGTKTLGNISVAGITQGFAQPASPGTVSGTQSVSFPANTNISYSNIVTTIDGKVITVITGFNFGANRYFGWITDTTGIGTTGFDNSKITALNNEFSMSKVKSWNTGAPTGTQFYVFAYYYTAGDLNNFAFNTFPSIESMNHVQRSFTNALGFTGQWIIYWNKNGQTLSSDLTTN
jgi:hypothetical protein